MPSEPSHIHSIADILLRLTEPGLYQDLLNDYLSNVRDKEQSASHLGGVKLPGERVVNLWLNTVFAHGGIEGRNKRQDFDAAVDEYGHGFFEYAFRTLVRSLGMEYRNISSLVCKPLLYSCEKEQGLLPSFRMHSAFGTKRREVSKEGHVIIRQGSSEFFTEESFEERYRRILSRPVFKDLKRVLESIEAEEGLLIRAVLKASTFSGLIQVCDGDLVIDNAVSPDHLPNSRERLRISTGLEARQVQHHHSRATVYAGARIVTNDGGREILDDLLSVFRKQLVEE
jgi:hypothetical protein